MAGTVYERLNIQKHELELTKDMTVFRILRLENQLKNPYLRPKTREHMATKLDILRNVIIQFEIIIKALEDGDFYDNELLPGLSRAYDMIESEAESDE